MKKQLILLLTAGILTFGSLTAAPVQAQNNSERLLIALLTSSAAEDAAASQQAINGARLAVEVINAGGGVLDPNSPETNPKRFTFELRERSAPTAAEMRSAIQASIEDKPVAIVGPFVTAQANGNLDLANTNQIPQLVGTSGDPTGTGVTGQYIFRTRAAQDTQSRDLALTLIRDRYYTEIATAADTSTDGADGVDAFSEAARTAGVTIETEVSYSADATDLSAAAQTLYDANPEVIAVFGNARTAALMVTTLRGKGYAGVIAVNAPADEFGRRVGPAGEGVILPALWLPQTQDRGSARFAAAYRLRYNQEPDYHAALAFDSVVIAAGAVKLEGGTPEDVRAAMSASTGSFGGVQGVYRPTTTGGGRLINTTLIYRIGADGIVREEARYADGNCVRSCADTSPRDINALTTGRDEIVTIGFVAPQVGTAGEIGRRALEGAQLAVNEINTAGGILGANNTRYKIELRSLSASTPEETRAAIQTLIAGGSAAILGPTLVSPLLPSLSLAPTARVPQLVSASSSLLIGANNQTFTFLLRPADSIAAGSLARYLTDIRGYTRLATVSSTTNYAQDAVGAFNTIVKTARGADIVATVSHPVTETNFTNNVVALLAAKPEVIAAYTSPEAAAALLKELRASGYKGLFAYGAITQAEFLSLLSIEEAAGVIGTGSWAPMADDQASQRFVERFRITFSELPDAHSVAYYDAVYMLASVIQSGGPAPATIQSNLARLDLFAGVQGEYRPGSFGLGQLSGTVMIFAVDSEGNLEEISRWIGADCVNSCY